ncbi:hypothetical protein HRbin17_02615 [bacterium HR17]|uniref:Uncharacterized protein n=1 Tax=Candidatus Fervidibacter japonicus TaxID=2035412 RepID=A0A2H5XFW6_9BACT|nr:hypothetical protein HRbin17_02615 [bacterium HR17]
MTTPRERMVILVLITLGLIVLLWSFSETYRQNMGETLIVTVGEFHAHDAPIVTIALSPDGRLLATAAKDNTVKLWRLPNRQLLHTLKGHTRTITCLAFTPDSQHLISGGADMTVRMWQVATGKLERLWDADHTTDWHTGWIQAVAVSPDGKVLATGSRDTTVKLWDLATGQLRRTLWGHEDTVTALAFSPQETRLLASGSTDGTVWVWDIDKGEPVVKHPPLGYNPLCLAWTPDGRALAVGGYTGMGVRVIDWQTGKQIAWCSGMEGNVWAIAFSRDGQLIAAGCGDNAVWIFETRTGKRLRTIRENVGRQAGSDYWNDVRGVAFLPDNTLVAAMEDGNVRMWRLTGIRIHIPTPQLPSLPDEHGHGH